MSRYAEGETVDRYRIESLLGRGGMGHVYRAYDTRLRRYVALKVISVGPPDGAPQPEIEETLSVDQCARLVREAQAAAGLRHASIVTIFDVGDADGAPYIAMELLEGSSLRAYIQKTVPIERKVRWLHEIASGLAAAHRAGLVHRDIKPDNLMVCADDAVKILDFGIAKITSSAAAGEPLSSGQPSLRTGDGDVIGTPRYMAPEQASGLSVDARTDQFAWGVTAYELLAGVHPRDASSGFSAASGWSAPARDLSELSADLAPVASIVMRALERKAGARFSTMDDLAQALAPKVRPRAVGEVIAEPSGAPKSLPPVSAAATVTSPPTMGAPKPAAPRGAAPGVSSRRSLLLALGAVVILGAGVMALQRPPETVTPVATPVTAATSVATPPLARADASASASADADADASADANADANASASAVRVSHRATVSFSAVASGAYPNDVILGLLGARKVAIESCLRDGASVREGAHVFANLDYAVDGHDARFRFDCRVVSAPACQCIGRAFARPLTLAPPRDDRAGTLTALVSIQP